MAIFGAEVSDFLNFTVTTLNMWTPKPTKISCSRVLIEYVKSHSASKEISCLLCNL